MLLGCRERSTGLCSALRRWNFQWAGSPRKKGGGRRPVPRAANAPRMHDQARARQGAAHARLGRSKKARQVHEKGGEQQGRRGVLGLRWRVAWGRARWPSRARRVDKAKRGAVREGVPQKKGASTSCGLRAAPGGVRRQPAIYVRGMQKGSEARRGLCRVKRRWLESALHEKRAALSGRGRGGSVAAGVRAGPVCVGPAAPGSTGKQAFWGGGTKRASNEMDHWQGVYLFCRAVRGEKVGA